MKYIKLRINKILPNNVIGKIVTVETDKQGIPLNKFWRDRLQDAKTDNCVTRIDLEKPSATKSSGKNAAKENS